MQNINKENFKNINMEKIIGILNSSYNKKNCFGKLIFWRKLKIYKKYIIPYFFSESYPRILKE